MIIETKKRMEPGNSYFIVDTDKITVYDLIKKILDTFNKFVPINCNT
jgi:hypothetical protein